MAMHMRAGVWDGSIEFNLIESEPSALLPLRSRARFKYLVKMSGKVGQESTSKVVGQTELPGV